MKARCKLLFMMLVPCIVQAQKLPKPVKLKPLSSTQMEVKEPSDIFHVPWLNGLYVVSDDGYLAETTMDGKLRRKADFKGFDLEGVTYHDGHVYVVDEMNRRVHSYEAPSLKYLQSYLVPYHGGRNKGYESLLFNPQKNRFLIITEKDPIHFIELDSLFERRTECEWKWKVGDISSATFHNGRVWLLSDEDRLVIECDPSDYSVISTYIIPVINPEGIAFVDTTKFVVVSDDMQRLYTFQLPN